MRPDQDGKSSIIAAPHAFQQRAGAIPNLLLSRLVDQVRYRPGIDGLRALAVMSVVFYHAAVPGFTGGFVGVDVFFVISGYLITSLISEEIRQERFSIVSFYERRVRRIFPALFVVLLVTSILATWRFMPLQFQGFSSGVFATAIFGSNLLFWRRAGYFAASATEEPLLHTWSLAVEGQFYVVCPLVLFAIHRWLKGSWIAWLAPIVILSFALSVWGAAYKPSATFYLAPTRAWELLLGSLLALNAVPRLSSRPLMEALSLAGLCSIAWGVFVLSRSSPFPGLNALFPCLGAALVIYSGESTPTAARRLLEAKPLVFVGLISYSLYLWHWPLLVFARYWTVHELTGVETAAVVGLSFLAAILSWKFVESPFRARGGVFEPTRLFATAAAATAFLAVFGMYGYLSHGWPERIPLRAVEIASYSTSQNPRKDECYNIAARQIPIDQACNYGADVLPSHAVSGDSHAGTLMDAVGKVAKKHNLSVKFLVSTGCPPVLNVGREFDYYKCASNNAKYMDYILRSDIKTVILIGRYSLYVDGFTVDMGPAERYERSAPYITDFEHAISKKEDRLELLRVNLDKTVKSLLQAGKRVVLVYPIPEVGYNVPSALAAWYMTGRNPQDFTIPFHYYTIRQGFIFDILDAIGNTEAIIRLYPHKYLCNNIKCIVYADGKPLYYDDDHLSLAGADFIAPLFDPLFATATPQSGESVLMQSALSKGQS